MTREDIRTEKLRIKQTGRGWQWTKSKRARQIFNLTRWVHVYLSTALLGLLIFFSFTGLLLNHLSWFQHEGDYNTSSESLPIGLLGEMDQDQDPPLAKLEAFVADRLGLTNPRKIDIDREFGELIFDYPLPAGYAMVTFSVDDQEMRVEHQEGTLLALLNDLHKGRHTGGAWSWVIDISAIFMILMAFSGLIILFQQAKWRIHGLVFVLLGVLFPWLLYLAWVPKLN